MRIGSDLQGEHICCCGCHSYACSQAVEISQHSQHCEIWKIEPSRGIGISRATCAVKQAAGVTSGSRRLLRHVKGLVGSAQNAYSLVDQITEALMETAASHLDEEDMQDLPSHLQKKIEQKKKLFKIFSRHLDAPEQGVQDTQESMEAAQKRFVERYHTGGKAECHCDTLVFVVKATQPQHVQDAGSQAMVVGWGTITEERNKERREKIEARNREIQIATDTARNMKTEEEEQRKLASESYLATFKQIMSLADEIGTGLQGMQQEDLGKYKLQSSANDIILKVQKVQDSIPSLKNNFKAQEYVTAAWLWAEKDKKSYDIRAKVCDEFQMLADGIVRAAMAEFRFEVADKIASDSEDTDEGDDEKE